MANRTIPQKTIFRLKFRLSFFKILVHSSTTLIQLQFHFASFQNKGHFRIIIKSNSWNFVFNYDISYGDR